MRHSRADRIWRRRMATVAAPPGAPAALPIVVGVIDAAPAEAALRYAFAEAERRGVPLTVVATGRATADEDVSLHDQVRRWADKHAGVDVTLVVRRRVDAVITLAAASRQAGLLVLQSTAEPRTAVTVNALVRWAHSAVHLVGESPAGVVSSEPSKNAIRAEAERLRRCPAADGPVGL